MGYLFLSIALLSGATKGFCAKKISGYAENTKSAVLLNGLRMCLCVVLSFFVLVFTSDIKYLTLDPIIVLISAFSGVSTSFFVVSWLLAVRKSAYMMLDVFLMLGTLVPMVFGYFIFSEPITVKQWGGFILLLAATFIMMSYNNSVKEKISIGAILLLLACGLSNGITSLSQKIFAKNFSYIPISIFNFYTYAFATVTLAFLFTVLSRNEKIKFEQGQSKKTYLYICIMAGALTAHSYFSTVAALYLDSAHLYPLSQGASLILSALMANVFFKEKLTLKAIFGITLAFISLLIINI